MASDSQVLSSVRNAARLLKQFSAREREFGVSELARRLDLGKSTVHRLLITLATEHLVEQDAITGRYRLGIGMYDLGAAVAVHLDLHEAVVPPMEQLRAATGETVHVAVLDGHEVVYVERLDSPQGLRLFLEIGRRNAAHTTATGKCLLAFLPDVELAALLSGWKLEAQTPHTITDKTRLRRELAEVRRRGYAQNLNESEVGLLSVAAPIRAPGGDIAAAISAAGPMARLEPAMGATIQAVLRAAALASRRLGYRR